MEGICVAGVDRDAHRHLLAVEFDNRKRNENGTRLLHAGPNASDFRYFLSIFELKDDHSEQKGCVRVKTAAARGEEEHTKKRRKTLII